MPGNLKQLNGEVQGKFDLNVLYEILNILNFYVRVNFKSYLNIYKLIRFKSTCRPNFVY